MNDSKVTPVEAQAVPDLPVAWLDKWGEPHRRKEDARDEGDETEPVPVFTRPTPAAAADLTDERIRQIAASIPVDPAGKGDEWFPVFARAIEAELVAASPAAAADLHHAKLHDWLAERHENALHIAATKRGADRDGWLEDADYFRRAMEAVAVAASPAAAADQPKLSVWYGKMPESNGRNNWTAILHRGDMQEGFTIERSEYPDRVRYEADRVRYLIGEIKDEPYILDYNGDERTPCHLCGGSGVKDDKPCWGLNFDGTAHDTAELVATSPAAAAACPTCGESEPFTGRCGTNDRDTKALCKRAAAAAGVPTGWTAEDQAWTEQAAAEQAEQFRRDAQDAEQVRKALAGTTECGNCSGTGFDAEPDGMGGAIGGRCGECNGAGRLASSPVAVPGKKDNEA